LQRSILVVFSPQYDPAARRRRRAATQPRQLEERLMSRSSERTAVTALVVTIALALAALAVTAQASAATIYACVKKKGGSVHIVGKRAKCKKGETKMSWNSPGPAGNNGAQGAPGLSGSQGNTGGPGPQGPGPQGIEATQNGIVAFTPIATVGRWTIETACENGSIAHIKFTGPGTYADTASRGPVGGTAETINNTGAIGAGVTLSMGANTQMYLSMFLFDEHSIEQVDLEFWDSAVDHDCIIVGEAIPAV
jgi:hypothetical protein